MTQKALGFVPTPGYDGGEGRKGKEKVEARWGTVSGET